MGSYTDESGVEGDDALSYGASLPVPNVQEMVRRNPLEVPERYIRTKESVLDINSVLSPEIPVIDMSYLSRGCPDELEKLHKACENWGFFQVVDHGMPREVMQAMKEAAAEFFDLPLEEKNKYSMPSDDIQGYGHAYVVSEDQKLDWSDTLILGIHPNQFRWLEYWPTTPEHFRETLDTYSAEVRRIGEELMGSILVTMGLGKDAMLQLQGEFAQAVRMNYYPTCRNPAEVIGISPHSDTSTITILMQSEDTEGLQIRHDGAWVPVKPVSDALVVNLGDIVEIWTNGKYKSVEHRAVTNDEKPRMSLASFLYPFDDVDIEPLAHMVDPKRATKLYKKVKYGEYLRQSMKRKHEGKAHTDVAKV